MTSSYKEFDLLSFQLGMAAAFCEMVQQGVKKLALSPPIDQKDLPQLEKALYEVAGHYGVSVWIDPAFLPSQLAREEDLKDKAVALLYRDEQMLTAYRQLKERRQKLKDQGLSQQNVMRPSPLLCGIFWDIPGKFPQSVEPFPLGVYHGKWNLSAY